MELGDEVKCGVTGASGIVVCVIKMLHGADRYAVQPPIKEPGGSIPDQVELDKAGIVVTTKNKITPIPIEHVGEVKLGDEVLDPITEVTGVAVNEQHYINGCVRFGVQQKKERETTGASHVPGIKSFPSGQLKLVTKEKAPEGQKRTGGPMERIQREPRICGT